MKKRDIKNKPLHIILKNLHESQKTKFGMLTILFPAIWAISMLVACTSMIIIGSVIGSPLVYTSLLSIISKILSITSLSVFITSCLYVFCRTIIKSIKEIDNIEEKDI